MKRANHRNKSIKTIATHSANTSIFKQFYLGMDVPWSENLRHSGSSISSSLQLQAAAYLLLTYVNMHEGTTENDEVLTIMKWLESKQNSKGGFSTTQVENLSYQLIIIIHVFFVIYCFMGFWFKN